MEKQINVVGAVIVHDGLVLCAQRGPDGALPGMWEFPGGKIDQGETPEQALGREIHEELNCVDAVGQYVNTASHRYDFGTVNLSAYYCRIVDGRADTVGAFGP